VFFETLVFQRIFENQYFTR